MAFWILNSFKSISRSAISSPARPNY
jgi:hypothetical protein